LVQISNFINPEGRSH